MIKNPFPKEGCLAFFSALAVDGATADKLGGMMLKDCATVAGVRLISGSNSKHHANTVFSPGDDPGTASKRLTDSLEVMTSVAGREATAFVSMALAFNLVRDRRMADSLPFDMSALGEVYTGMVAVLDAVTMAEPLPLATMQLYRCLAEQVDSLMGTVIDEDEANALTVTLAAIRAADPQGEPGSAAPISAGIDPSAAAAFVVKVAAAHDGGDQHIDYMDHAATLVALSAEARSLTKHSNPINDIAVEMVEVLEEAMNVHVYGDDPIPADCGFVELIQRARAALGLEPATIATRTVYRYDATFADQHGHHATFSRDIMGTGAGADEVEYAKSEGLYLLGYQYPRATKVKATVTVAVQGSEG